MYDIIQTPFSGIKTLRLSESDTFRPCSTGTDLEEMQLHTEMERYENRTLSKLRDMGIAAIASAAHIEQTKAKENAITEAVERVSLASWWTYRRQPVYILTTSESKQLLENVGIDTPRDFSFSIGLAPSSSSEKTVAYSILSNTASYPFAVLGGGCDTDEYVAIEKAAVESVQSWVGSVWMSEHREPIYWDVHELLNRANSISTKPCITTSRLLDKIDIDCNKDEFAYCAIATSSLITSIRSYELAKLDRQPGEYPMVFTEHNF
ncbi:YcaO-like family protein [Candidatus Saccharibacteria bacterium]|nr:YcaO-like family protein [Candidatus Saccharibacteria bacterium]